ncbi:sigma-54-dependent transcriptional regulator [Parachryseolinea silvisoli]|uniref:sigma-54-dependent transcriptional regulator n=1 Tax=Parachryseolinea silvisoli TaxID=2873601 RepID=UPI0022659ABF|nr:sigma-54 dependent transcriptional regulator [Parachryseolinea silvisoli]MCD9015762.1 sigma-54 dependent transcriptional regulator [Parachryseolinea silvisoli]
MKQKILIVEDQFIEANNLQMILERAGHRVCTIAQSVHEAWGVVEQERPTLVLIDIYLKGKLTGIDLARGLKEQNIPFVYLSANSHKTVLDEAKATQPYGFLVKPFREKDVLVTLDIAHYLHENSLESRLRHEPGLQDQLTRLLPTRKNDAAEKDIDSPISLGIVGNSKALRHVWNHVRVVAPSDTSVLILGESGTGKERIAEAIHQFSPRRTKPLVKVNCAALPATLIESELFGHAKGAFTGASEKRIGKFEQADGGTIFLDEVGEIPLELQAKLLRVLQEKEIEPLGGKAPIKINIRIITATNRNLEKALADGRFRIDLYYRLNVFPIVVPPLRERKEDIPDLVRHFVQYYSRKLGRPLSGVTDEVMKQLLHYSWPGNIRELENLMERSALLSQGTVIEDCILPQQSKKENIDDSRSMQTLEENEREHILAALQRARGKVFGEGGAAELLGMNVSTLNARIRKLGIEKKTHWD